MLPAQDELLRQLDREPVRSEALQMIRSWTFNALQNLDGISRYSAAAAVVMRAAEAIDLLIVDVEVHVRVLLEAFQVVELVARANYALFDLFIDISLGSRLIDSKFFVRLLFLHVRVFLLRVICLRG